MRNPTETQKRIFERIRGEFDKSGIKVFESRTGLVENSPTEDIYQFVRAEGFEIYVYENGEADLHGPLRTRIFETPDFDSPAELEESILEEVILQARPGELPGDRYKKLESRRLNSQIAFFVSVLIIAIGLILLWSRTH